MRAIVLAAILAQAGCAQILGIDDPRGDACSPFEVSTCAITDTCDVSEETGVLECRPEGGLDAYQPCETAGDSCSGAKTCLAGLCRRFCDENHGCTQPGDAACTWFVSPTSRVCDADCNVLDGGGCAAAQECILDYDTTGGDLLALCVPQGYLGSLPQGELCEFLGHCAPGLVCDVITGGDNRCHPLCTVGGADCAGTCVSIGQLHQTMDLGVCRQ
jgi:hypothetical protein